MSLLTVLCSKSEARGNVSMMWKPRLMDYKIAEQIFNAA